MPDIFVAEEKEAPAAKKPTEVLDKKPISTTPSYYEEEGTVRLFTTYCKNPNDITFENQEVDEKVILFIRKALITNLPWFSISMLLLLAPLFIIPILMYFKISIFIFPQKFNMFFVIYYYLLVTIYLFINFITWYFNIDLVTEKRVIDVDFQGLVYKNIASTKISLVQDVSYAQIGALRTIFNYGDVLVQTAGTIDNFIFESVPKPEDAVHVVANLIGKRNE